jgi:hypothetical protein
VVWWADAAEDVVRIVVGDGDWVWVVVGEERDWVCREVDEEGGLVYQEVGEEGGREQRNAVYGAGVCGLGMELHHTMVVA